ncbi:hypothetical protein F3Y22_tig00111640pilonHSYRG00135 [Hibiscus syriacus]|uniref:Uncharacterized protein n=1 Tax=Hibiscus syriacus TaxID=106335 RepID=A0A6A2XK58_HIBSY|nr:hypothetical protein F3Y22_tig00111640pilonHSYRG00135 [Hibiscus syriacus]
MVVIPSMVPRETSPSRISMSSSSIRESVCCMADAEAPNKVSFNDAGGFGINIVESSFATPSEGIKWDPGSDGSPVRWERRDRNNTAGEGRTAGRWFTIIC